MCLGLALLALAAPAARGPQPEPRQPVFRAGVRVVRVDVSVTGRRDTSVTDLTAADFTLEEDGVPQAIDSAQFVRLDGRRGPGDEDSLQIRSREHGEAEAARDDVRLFAIFFDDYHVDRLPGVTVPMRAALEHFIRGLGPNDLVVLMDPLTPLSALRFTRDQAALLDQVRKWEGRQGELFPIRSPLEEGQAYAHNRAMVRAEVTLSALNALVTYLGGLRDGRSSVIFVSQGPATFFGTDGNLEDQMRELLRNASRGNVAIHALDPRGLGDSGRGGDRDTLLRLGYETGGRPIVNTNGLDRGLDKVVAFASAYYLLGYTPTRDADDGRFHRISVKVKRPGIEVLARRGYWAPSAEAVRAAMLEAVQPVTPAVAEALEPMAASRNGRSADLWVGIRPAASGPARASVTWEPAASAPPATPAPRALTVELLDRGTGEALGDPVTIVSSRGIVGMAGVAGFDLPDGPTSIRLTALGAGDEVLDRWTQPVEVPAVPADGLPLATLEFRRARSAFEMRALRDMPDAAPAASRRFVRTDRVQVRVPLPGLQPAPVVEAGLLNTGGQRLASLAVEMSDGRATFELPLTSLVPAAYLVRVRITAGQRSVEQLAAFELIP